MTKVCVSVDIQDRITCATFGDDRLGLRGLGVARGRISHYPIDLRRRPYNTLALPCECVMCLIQSEPDCRTHSHHMNMAITLPTCVGL